MMEYIIKNLMKNTQKVNVEADSVRIYKNAIEYMNSFIYAENINLISIVLNPVSKLWGVGVIIFLSGFLLLSVFSEGTLETKAFCATLMVGGVIWIFLAKYNDRMEKRGCCIEISLNSGVVLCFIGCNDINFLHRVLNVMMRCANSGWKYEYTVNFKEQKIFEGIKAA